MTSKGGSTPFSVNMEAKVVAVAISKHVSMSMGGSESPFRDKPLERSRLYFGMTCLLVTGPYKSYVAQQNIRKYCQEHKFSFKR